MRVRRVATLSFALMRGARCVMADASCLLRGAWCAVLGWLMCGAWCVAQVLGVANLYNIPPLKRMCAEIVSRGLCVENVASLLQAA